MICHPRSKDLLQETAKPILFIASAVTQIPYYLRIPALRILSYLTGEME